MYALSFYIYEFINLIPSRRYKPPLTFPRKLEFICAFAMVHYRIKFLGFHIGKVQIIEVHDYSLIIKFKDYKNNEVMTCY